MKRFFAVIALLATVCIFSIGDSAQPVKPNAAKHGRGYKPPTKEISAARHVQSNAEHGARLRGLRKATGTVYDCRNLAQVVTVGDQGSCGNCYMWSGFEVAACSQLTANIVSLTTTPTFGLSVQYGLDCHPEFGGCDGGDAWQVCQTIMASGAPSWAQYPGAGQSAGRCNNSAPLTYKIVSMGYADPDAGANGVANTQAGKNALVQYGPLSTAVAAGSNDWDNPAANGVLNGPGANDNSIDHQILIIGWVDNASVATYNIPTCTQGGYWICQNQWGTSWALNGIAFIPYGAYSIATELFFVTATALPPPPPPPPPGPGPNPGPTTATMTGATFTYSDGSTLTVEISAVGTRSAIGKLQTDVAAIPTMGMGKATTSEPPLSLKSEFDTYKKTNEARWVEMIELLKGKKQ